MNGAAESKQSIPSTNNVLTAADTLHRPSL